MRELDGEVQALAAAFRTGGMSRLNQSVIERSSVPGSFFYVLVGPTGEKISGDFSAIPDDIPMAGSRETFFEYQSINRNGELETRSANGIIVRLPNQAALMVAYDLGARRQITGRITQAVWTAGIAGLVLSLLGGLIISRSAARRAEALARTAEEVMAGNLSHRAPVIGSGDEFDRLSERMNAMLDRIETLMAATRYAGDSIAHDLRSPLTRLRNRLEAALKNPDAVSQEETLHLTLTEVDSLLATFNAILRLSRVQAGDQARFVETDLSEICEELAELYGPVAEDAGLAFASEVAPGLSRLADRSLIAQALTNLLDNSIKYTPKGGALTLRGRRTRKGDFELSVTDTGPGIAASDRERAVERFVRLQTSRTASGNGLGLALVAAVANLHQGRLELGDGAGDETLPGLRAALVLPHA